MDDKTADLAARKPIILVSKEGEQFEVERGVACMSQLVNDVLSDVSADEEFVPISNIEASVLAKVIEYCRYHYVLKSISQTSAEIEQWDNEFIDVDKDTLVKITEAANFMDISDLLLLCVETISKSLRGKTAKAIREEWDLVNDLTEEEEAQIRKANEWCDDALSP